MDALLDPFPPVRNAARACSARWAARAPVLEFARFGLLSVRRFAGERFRGDAAGRLLAGNALHPDIGPDTPGGALFAMVLVGLGQEVGWPVPEGGAGRLTDALVARLRSQGRPGGVRRAGRAGRWCAGGAPSACAAGTAARPRRAARCSPTPARRSSTSTCSSASTCPRACSTTCGGASSTTSAR